MSLRVALLSDIHAEFYPADWLPPLPQPTECDVLVLGGDIAVADGAIDFVTRVAEVMVDTPVLWVAGNHEFYGQDYDDQLSRYRDAFEDHSQVHFLERDRVIIEGVAFLGTTLWTGFDVLGKDNIDPGMAAAEASIADFLRIQKDSGKRVFTATDVAALFEQNTHWLNQALTDCDADKTVVVSHFPPLRTARNPGFPEDLLATYFQAHAEALIERHRPDLWIYGHNHWSDNHRVQQTRLVSNQLGYPRENGIPGAGIVVLSL